MITNTASATALHFLKQLRPSYSSVIIPVYKDVEGLEDTLRSLSAQTLPRSSFEIIVSNDGNDEAIHELCRKYQVHCVACAPRQGSYAARNTALEVSSGEYIAFIDADETVSPEWLAQGVLELAEAEYVAGAVDIDVAKASTSAHWYEYLSAFDTEKKLHAFHFAPTAHLFVRRSVIEAVGGFDGRLFSGGDVEFGDRIWRTRRYRMRYSPRIRTIHPPRTYSELVAKERRIKCGTRDLLTYYPERFAGRNDALKVLRVLLYPLYRTLTSSRKIAMHKRISLIPFACWFGLVSCYFYITIVLPRLRGR